MICYMGYYAQFVFGWKQLCLSVASGSLWTIWLIYETKYVVGGRPVCVLDDCEQMRRATCALCLQGVYRSLQDVQTMSTGCLQGVYRMTT